MRKGLFLSKIIFSVSLIIYSNSLFAQSSQFNFTVVNTTTLTVGLKEERIYTFNFPRGNSTAPYKLILRNGNGVEQPELICSNLGFISKTVCNAQKLISNFIISKDRVAISEIILNGNKIISSKEMNLKVASLEIPIELQDQNTIQIKIAGWPTGSLTFEIKGQSLSTPQNLSILYPVEGQKVDNTTVNIRGLVNSSEADLKLVFENEEHEIQFTPGTEFSYQYDYLNPGLNYINMTLYSGTKVLDSQSIAVIYIPQEAQGSLISTAGGTISVSDNASSINGASIQIPSGALTEPEYFVIQRGDSWGPNVPFTFTELSPSVTVTPYFKYFFQDFVITIPLDNTKLPPGSRVEDIKIYGFGENGWEIIQPTSISSSAVTLKANIINYYTYKLVIENPLLAGDLLVESNVGGANIYLDGEYQWNDTPAVLKNIQTGIHTVKLYKEGYNEVIQTIDYPFQNKLNIQLPRLTEATSEIIFDSTIKDKMTVSNESFQVRGHIRSIKDIKNEDFVVMAVNSGEFIQPLNKDGTFVFNASLLKANNYLQVRATINGKTSVSQRFRIRRNFKLESDKKLSKFSKSIQKIKASPASLNIGLSALSDIKETNQEIKVTLTWEDSTRPMDLRIFHGNEEGELLGSASFMENPNGLTGGVFSGGQNSITFILPKSKVGTYAVYPWFFQGSQVATFRVFLAGELIHEFHGYVPYFGGEFVFWVNDIEVFWVGENSLPQIIPGCGKYINQKYKCDGYAIGSGGELRAQTILSPSLSTSRIKYRVKELTRGYQLKDTEITQFEYSFSFFLNTNPTPSLTSPRLSIPLVYEIIAYTDFDESDPYYVVQTPFGQIYQEYYDKKQLEQSFIHFPYFGYITNDKDYPADNVYSFREMNSYSDFKNSGWGSVNKSALYGNLINNAYKEKYPASSRLTLSSGWRNPRRNDSLAGSDINSYHQTGDALDLLPPGLSVSPDKIYINDQKLIDLCNIAFAATYDTDVIYHLGHVHIEPQSFSAGRVKKCFTNLKKK